MSGKTQGIADSAWTHRLCVNQYVDVLDTARNWCEAVVIGLSQRKVHVHYRGWPIKFNEWIQFDSPRLAPAYTRVHNWRALSKGSRVQLGTTLDGQRRRLWRNGTVLQTRRGRVDSAIPAQVLVQLDGDREKRWVEAEDDLLCAEGTHTVAQPKPDAGCSDNEGEPIELSVGSDSASSSGSSDDDDGNDDDDEPGPRTSATKRSRDGVALATRTAKRKHRDRASRAKTRSTYEKGGCDDLATWRESLAPGVELEVLDKEGNHWYEARVFGQRDDQVGVRFRGWPWCYDEWVDRASGRLAPVATHLGRWRDFKVDHEVQIGFKSSANADAPSHWERGIVKRVARGRRTLSVRRIEVLWDGGDGPQSEWRDAQDDLLAPIGVPTHPLPKPNASRLEETELESDVDDGNELSADADANHDNEEEDEETFVMQVAGQKEADDAGELGADVLDDLLCSLTPDDLKKAMDAHPPDAPTRKQRKQARKERLLAAVEAAFASSESSESERTAARPPRARRGAAVRARTRCASSPRTSRLPSHSVDRM